MFSFLWLDVLSRSLSEINKNNKLLLLQFMFFMYVAPFDWCNKQTFSQDTFFFPLNARIYRCCIQVSILISFHRIMYERDEIQNIRNRDGNNKNSSVIWEWKHIVDMFLKAIIYFWRLIYWSSVFFLPLCKLQSARRVISIECNTRIKSSKSSNDRLRDKSGYVDWRVVNHQS